MDPRFIGHAPTKIVDSYITTNNGDEYEMSKEERSTSAAAPDRCRHDGAVGHARPGSNNRAAAGTGRTRVSGIDRAAGRASRADRCACARCPDAFAPAAADKMQTFAVTGSRVDLNGNDSPTPVTVLSMQDLQAARPTMVFEVLLDDPVFACSLGQALAKTKRVSQICRSSRSSARRRRSRMWLHGGMVWNSSPDGPSLRESRPVTYASCRCSNWAI